MKKHCVVYCRVSTAEQAAPGHHSLDAQEILCRRYAESHDLAVAEVIRDEGYSGRTTKRPGLRRLLEYTGAKPPVRIDAILVQDTSRMGRDSTEYLIFRRNLAAREIALVAVTQPNIDGSPEGRLVDTILAGINQYQSEEKGRRVSIAMTKKFEEGWWPSKAPLGYQNVVQDGHHRIEPDPERFPLMQWTFQEYATGRYSQEGLLRVATEKGLRDRQGRPLTRGSFNKHLANPFYWGLLRWDKEERLGKHVPLTDRETWEHCQAVTAAHNKYVSRQRKHQFFLAGLTTCAICRHRHTQTVVRKKGKRYLHCPARAKCTEPYIPEEVLADQVQARLERIEFSDQFLEGLVDRIREIIAQRNGLLDHKRAILQRQLTTAEQRRTALEHKLLEGTLSDEAFGRLMPTIERDLGHLRHQLDKIERSRCVDTSILRELLKAAQNIPRAYASANFVSKRRYIDFFYAGFIVRDRRIVEALPSPFLTTLLSCQRVRISANGQPFVDTNRTVLDLLSLVTDQKWIDSVRALFSEMVRTAV